MKSKFSILLAVLMLTASYVFLPVIIEKSECISSTVKTDITYAQALRKSNQALRKCMLDSFHTLSSSRILPSFLVVSVWPFSQGLEATLAANMAGILPDADEKFLQQLKELDYFWDATSNPPGYDSTISTLFEDGHAKYYDDNHWIGLLLLEAYQLYHQDWMLQRAKQIMELDFYGSIGTDKMPKPGGVFWTQMEGWTYRATVSTAGSAQLALRLYLVTFDARYLKFARDQIAWVDKNLRAPNGLYWDGVNADGRINRGQWTYNQGLMTGNLALLYKITGKKHYMDEAKGIASDTIAFYGVGDRLWLQPPEFNAILFKNLLLTDSIGGGSQYRQFMARYAVQVSRHLNAIGIFQYQSPNAVTSFLTQSATVQILADLVRPIDDFK